MPANKVANKVGIQVKRSVERRAWMSLFRVAVITLALALFVAFLGATMFGYSDRVAGDIEDRIHNGFLIVAVMLMAIAAVLSVWIAGHALWKQRHG
jgi:di/tricarboxylate transporter